MLCYLRSQTLSPPPPTPTSALTLSYRQHATRQGLGSHSDTERRVHIILNVESQSFSNRPYNYRQCCRNSFRDVAARLKVVMARFMSIISQMFAQAFPFVTARGINKAVATIYFHPSSYPYICVIHGARASISPCVCSFKNCCFRNHRTSQAQQTSAIKS